MNKELRTYHDECRLNPAFHHSTFVVRHSLEACLAYAGDLSLIGKFAEADTADAVIAEIRMRTTADLAAVVSASGEFSRSLLFKDH